MLAYTIPTSAVPTAQPIRPRRLSDSVLVRIAAALMGVDPSHRDACLEGDLDIADRSGAEVRHGVQGDQAPVADDAY